MFNRKILPMLSIAAMTTMFHQSGNQEFNNSYKAKVRSGYGQNNGEKRKRRIKNRKHRKEAKLQKQRIRRR